MTLRTHQKQNQEEQTTKQYTYPKNTTPNPKNTNIKPNTHKTQRVSRQITIHATTNKQSIPQEHKIKPIITLMPLNIKPIFHKYTQ